MRIFRDVGFDDDAGNDDPQQNGAQIPAALLGEKALPAQVYANCHQQGHDGDALKKDAAQKKSSSDDAAEGSASEGTK